MGYKGTKERLRGSPRLPTEDDIDKITDRALQKAGVIPEKGKGTFKSLEANPDIKREEVRQIISNCLYWYNRSCVKSDEECAERLNEFFARINETGEIPTYEKMCLALGTTRYVVEDWHRGKVGAGRALMIQKAKELLAGLDAELAGSGRIPQVIYIFRSKNFYGMRDQVEIVPTTDNLQLKSADDLRKQYLDE